MKIPVRKLKTLFQYAVAGGFVIFVVLVVANFKELENKKSDTEEEAEWAALVKEDVKKDEIPRIPNKNVGIENIQEDSQPQTGMVDWHNWTHIQEERERVGPGEQGKALNIPKEESDQHQDLFRSNGFSGYASDLISVERAVPDIRHPGCRTKVSSCPTCQFKLFISSYSSTTLNSTRSPWSFLSITSTGPLY